MAADSEFEHRWPLLEKGSPRKGSGNREVQLGALASGQLHEKALEWRDAGISTARGEGSVMAPGRIPDVGGVVETLGCTAANG
jgi:hypothetical protein